MDSDSSNSQKMPQTGSKPRKKAGSIGENEERLDDLLESILNQSKEKALKDEPMGGRSREVSINSNNTAAVGGVSDHSDKNRSQDVSNEGVSEISNKEIGGDETVFVSEEVEQEDSLPPASEEAMALETAILTQIEQEKSASDEEFPEPGPSPERESPVHEVSVPASEKPEKIESTFEAKEEAEARFTKKDALSLALYVVLVFLLTFLIVHYVGQRTRVSGSSMEDTLSDGDNLIVDKISYRFSDPERFDIIIFPPRGDEDTYYIKRIIGLPGETVQIDDAGKIYINGKTLNENYGLDVIADPGMAREPITLEKDEFFVLGDNRNNSTDSRWPTVGAVERDDIIGRAWVRIYPFNKIKTLTKKDQE